jgi:hypothetical protein
MKRLFDWWKGRRERRVLSHPAVQDAFADVEPLPHKFARQQAELRRQSAPCSGADETALQAAIRAWQSTFSSPSMPGFGPAREHLEDAFRNAISTYLRVAEAELSIAREALEKLESWAREANEGCTGGWDTLVSSTHILRITQPVLARLQASRPVAACPCGEPKPEGYPPCTAEGPCSYAQGMSSDRWGLQAEEEGS